MPDIDGFQVASMIRSIENLWGDEIGKLNDIRRLKKKNCPIVAVTAFNCSDVNDRALKVGINRVLHKPVNIGQIRAVIKDYYLS